MATIPASAISNVTPGVLGAGGTALSLNGLVLSQSTRVPIGQVMAFSSAAAVTAYFGAGSNESDTGIVYFNGFDNSHIKPSTILFSQYNASAVSAYLRSGNVSALTLAQLQALNGTITMTIDGYTHASTVSLAAATSFSSAAAIIQAGLDTTVSVTGSVAANVVTGSIAPNTATGSIAGTTMTISAVGAGAVLAAGQSVAGSFVVAGTTIVAQLTGTAGSTGTYQVSITQTVTSTALTMSGGGLTVTAVTTGTLAVGQGITGAGVTALTAITALGTGTGGTGTYAVSISQTVGSETLTASGGTLTVTAVATGSLAVNDVLTGTGITVGNHITAFLTGSGGTGTYLVSVGDTATSTTITSPGAGAVITYDSVSGAFLVTSGTTGASSSMSYATGTLAAGLMMTAATGAVLSQGAAATTPAAAMDAIKAQTTNWATFMTAFDPDVSGNTNKQAFASWVNGQADKFAYVCWDTDTTPTLSTTATTSLGYILKMANSNGTVCMYAPNYEKAAFVCGAIASIDYTQTNGKTDLCYKAQTGLTADVTNQTVANNLEANSYNYYGAWATAAQNYIGLAPGSISGSFSWIDDYVNQIWMNSNFQLAAMDLLFSVKSIPYNSAGQALTRAAFSDPITSAANFGAFVPGVTLSALQISEINMAAGIPVDQTLFAQGYYLQILPATAQIRATRGSFPCTFWYTTGGSVHKLNLASIAIQ